MSSKINVEVHRIGNAIHYSRICFLRTPIFEKDLCFPKAETCLHKQPSLVLKNSGECQHCGRPHTSCGRRTWKRRGSRPDKLILSLALVSGHSLSSPASEVTVPSSPHLANGLKEVQVQVDKKRRKKEGMDHKEASSAGADSRH